MIRKLHEKLYDNLKKFYTNKNVLNFINNYNVIMLIIYTLGCWIYVFNLGLFMFIYGFLVTFFGFNIVSLFFIGFVQSRFKYCDWQVLAFYFNCIIAILYGIIKLISLFIIIKTIPIALAIFCTILSCYVLMYIIKYKNKYISVDKRTY